MNSFDRSARGHGQVAAVREPPKCIRYIHAPTHGIVMPGVRAAAFAVQLDRGMGLGRLAFLAFEAQDAASLALSVTRSASF